MEFAVDPEQRLLQSTPPAPPALAAGAGFGPVRCLGSSPVVPWAARLLVPLLLLANEALFISANTSIGASVYLILSAGDAEQVSTDMSTS